MKTTIYTEQAPAAIGPYSQGIAFQNIVYTSGQIGFIPETMTFPEGGIKAQAQQALQNLKSVLEAGGASLESVIKVTCFVADMNDFAAFNEVYDEFFKASKPARSCVEVSRLPKDALVELEAVAFKE